MILSRTAKCTYSDAFSIKYAPIAKNNVLHCPRNLSIKHVMVSYFDNDCSSLLLAGLKETLCAFVRRHGQVQPAQIHQQSSALFVRRHEQIFCPIPCASPYPVPDPVYIYHKYWNCVEHHSIHKSKITHI